MSNYPFPTQSTKGILEGLSVNLLVYGKPSTGKTWMCSTAPNPFLLGFEEGRRTLTNVDIPSCLIKTEEQFDEIEKWLKTETKFPFQTLCVDSLSSLGHMLLSTYFPRGNDDRLAYGKAQRRVLEFVKMVVENHAFDTYLICEETFVRDESGKFFYGPFIPGEKGSIRLPFMIDAVMRLKILSFKGENNVTYEERKLLTQTTETEKAKVQIEGLERYEEPNLKQLFSKLRGKKEKFFDEVNI